MRFNKIVKSLAIALPILVLSACSSNSDDSDAQGKLDNNAAMMEQQQKEEAERVKVAAMQKEQQIVEQRRLELERLKTEHIVYFDFDTSNVSNQFSTLLDAHAIFLNSNPEVKVLVEGHADERGTPEYNIALGERRAKSVVTYLENMGVSPNQITTVSYGEEKPMVRDRSSEAFAKNRRAVLVY